MMQTLAETGNAWVCFKDKANLRSAQTAKPGNVIHSSNLCTEILEVTNREEVAVCNLGSVNVGNFVTKDLKFDFDKLREVVDRAVTFLDRVVDINYYPIGEARQSNLKWRPVGLGLMGLQDAFFKMRLPFDSGEAQATSALVSETMYYQAVQTSVRLAREKGPFPAFPDSRYAEGKLQVQLATLLQEKMPELHYDWDSLGWQVKEHGIRNSLLIAIAPTATIASISGCYESIEPQVSNFFKRETLSGEFLNVNRYLVHDLKRLNLWNPAIRAKIIEAEGSIQGIAEIPDDVKALYKTVWEIPQKTLIEMAAARSAFICQSQSLNLFLEDPTLGKLSSMYMYAWKQGLKTTYYLRSRAKTAIQKTTVQEGVAPAAPKTVEPEQAIACSLENPESCEACQ
jgi:ribonucleoside-diphosphate reductase alpha chain